VGLFSWFFGRGAPPAVQLRREGSRGHFEVAGEYYNQDALKGIWRRSGKPESNIIDVHARLVFEDNNPHDSSAVRVEIAGRKVGYVPAGFAGEFRRRLQEMSPDSRAASCTAHVIEKQSGELLVVLNLDWPIELATTPRPRRVRKSRSKKNPQAPT